METVEAGLTMSNQYNTIKEKVGERALTVSFDFGLLYGEGCRVGGR